MIEAHWYFNLALVILPLLLILKLFKHKQQKYKNLPPSPPSLPIIGHLHLLKEPVHETLDKLSQKYGPILGLRFGVRKVLIVSSSSAVEECFTKNDIIFANRPRLILEKHLNYDCTTMGAANYGHLWRTLRRITALEVFSTARLAETSNLRREEAVLLVKQLVKSCGGDGSSTVDLKASFGELAINMVSMMIMGKRYYGEDVADPKIAVHFQGLMREFLQLLKISNIGDYLPIFRWMDFGGLEKSMIALMKRMDKFLQATVDEQRQKLRGNTATNGSREPQRLTMIDTLLALQETEPEFYTDQIVKGLIMVKYIKLSCFATMVVFALDVAQIMLIAGTESSFTTMEWAMSLLLNHPDTMKKIRSQIDSQVGHDRVLEEEDLPKLTHLQNAINETLRLFPAVPLLIPHYSSQDCTVGGYDVPGGTMLLVNAWTIHRDPSQWAEPEKFKPERFEGESGEGFKMVPFGAGRRRCPGVALAHKMVGLALGSLIQAFEWEKVGAEDVDMSAAVGFSLSKLKPLEAVCKPRANMIRHFL
ncbi:hypothetical protein RJ640_014222 [Escallonia rubra]|uniref:Cytochrome P450 n=1 Tax=Escallonia rubra TaxID=112253 RepID=A0AA88RE84_9ASTE|nr:hypothetical protein RJ640_014222 [Escallonia rubra]